jgi:hypothetical protein
MCNRDWIDAENRIQYDTTFEAATSAVETQESGTDIPDIPLEDDFDGACEIEDNDLWYMYYDFYEFDISYHLNFFIYFFKYFNYFLNFFF